MALKLAPLTSTSIIFVSVPKSPITSTQFAYLSLNSFSYRRRNVNGLKCSVDYKDRQYNQAAVEFPKPTEIPWKKELCNTVQLIGIVGAPVEIKQLPSGKVLAWTRLGVKKSATSTSWINLTFWDELAQVSFQHVEKGHQIYVSGRLITDTVENEDGKQQTYYKVVVQQLNFVERSFSSDSLYNQDSNNMMGGRKLHKNNGNFTGSIEELWQAFFANPSEWWDNRKNKRSPNYPDFKHKDTGEALWVEGRSNPSWVKSQLAVLDERMGSLDDRNFGMRVSTMSADDILSF